MQGYHAHPMWKERLTSIRRSSAARVKVDGVLYPGQVVSIGMRIDVKQHELGVVAVNGAKLGQR